MANKFLEKGDLALEPGLDRSHDSSLIFRHSQFPYECGEMAGAPNNIAPTIMPPP
jgi:hypothetical protein